MNDRHSHTEFFCLLSLYISEKLHKKNIIAEKQLIWHIWIAVCFKYLWHTFDNLSKVCFAEQPKTRELRTCSRTFISLISSQAHQTRPSHLQSSTQGSSAHACACMVANVNICGSYLCTPLSLKVHEWRSPAAGAWRLQEQELLHGPCRDIASSLRNCCDIWTHRISLPFPHFDLRPSWPESILVIPSTQRLLFLLSSISESIRVSFSLKQTE